MVDATQNTDNVDINTLFQTDINITVSLPSTLGIFVGAKVMFLSIIDLLKVLVNGAVWFIDEIIWPHFHGAQIYDTVL